MKYIVRIVRKTEEADYKNASVKPRSDFEEIFQKRGFKLVKWYGMSQGKENKLFYYLKRVNGAAFLYQFLSGLKLKEGDMVAFAVPVYGILWFFSNVIKHFSNKGVTMVALIHDVDSLRFEKYKINDVKHNAEFKALNSFDKIVVHNESMKKKLIEGGIQSKMISFEILDYLMETPVSEKPRDKGICFAANLGAWKCGFLYKERVDFGIPLNLYGPNYEGNTPGYVYKGAYYPEELTEVMEGNFGLVWDGDSVDECSGPLGRYLKINNPYKVSHYLACGIPVIIWSESAMASFIEKNNCGFSVSSLKEIKGRLEALSEEDYLIMQKNAVSEGNKLRAGYYTNQAIDNLLKEYE